MKTTPNVKPILALVAALSIPVLGTTAEPVRRSPGRESTHITYGQRKQALTAMRLERIRSGRIHGELTDGTAVTELARDLARADLASDTHPISPEDVRRLVFRDVDGVRFVPCGGPVVTLDWPGRIGSPAYAVPRAEIEIALRGGDDAGDLVRELRDEYVADFPRAVRLRDVETHMAFNRGLRAVDQLQRDIDRGVIRATRASDSAPCFQGTTVAELVDYVSRYQLTVCESDAVAMASVYHDVLPVWIEHRGAGNADDVDAYRAARDHARSEQRRVLQSRYRMFEARRQQRAAARERELQQRIAALRMPTGQQRFVPGPLRSMLQWYTVPVSYRGSTVHVGGTVGGTVGSSVRRSVGGTRTTTTTRIVRR